MKRTVAGVGGVLAIVISLALLLKVSIGGPGINVGNLWTIALCGVAGVLALEARLGWAAVLLVLGASPAIFGGVAFLYLPSLLLIALASLVPSRTSAS
jgi:hypothetical protein